MAETLDFETLVEELRAELTPEAAHKIERLIHTHIGGPMTTVFTQMQITEIMLKREPESITEELGKLKENIGAASENIRLIVRALAAAMRDEEG